MTNKYFLWRSNKYFFCSPVLEFSQEGSGDGDLCRPWGICCTPKGLIVVADRSNNRICVFNRDCSKFGTEGTRKGQFNQPASVVMESRMQIFIFVGWSNQNTKN